MHDAIASVKMQKKNDWIGDTWYIKHTINTAIYWVHTTKWLVAYERMRWQSSTSVDCDSVYRRIYFLLDNKISCKRFFKFFVQYAKPTWMRINESSNQQQQWVLPAEIKTITMLEYDIVHSRTRNYFNQTTHFWFR